MIDPAKHNHMPVDLYVDEWGHIEMPINKDGEGPEMDPDKVVAVICWSCLPDETWPCKAMQEARDEVHSG